MDDETRAAIAALTERLDRIEKLLEQRFNSPVHPEMHAPKLPYQWPPVRGNQL